MSDFFKDKDYGDYLKKLESSAEMYSQRQKSVTPHKDKPSKRYKTVRIRPAFLAAVSIIVVAVVIAVSVGTGTEREEPSYEAEAEVQSEKTGLPTYAKYTNKTEEITDETDSASAIVIDIENNTVVAQKNAEERVYPASTTKIMTILTAVEYINDMSDTFVMTYEITDPLYEQEASVAGFLNGESVTMEDLLYGAILPSGADSTMALAIKIAGSEKAFVKLMNKKAEQLGLKNTHFENASGLFSQDQYTSAHDMAIMLQAAMKNEVCREVLSTYQHTTRKTEQNPEGILLSSTLFSYMYGTEPETATIMGGKTGFVNESGYCIATFGENNTTKKEYVVVTMRGSSLWPAIYGQIELYKQYVK